MVDAIAAGKKAAWSIDRFLRGESAREIPKRRIPSVYVEPSAAAGEEFQDLERIEPPALPAAARKRNFAEVELTLTPQQAAREARRCLRCDLRFTAPGDNKASCCAVEGKQLA